MSRAVFICGAAATAQGKHPDRTAWDLGIEAFSAGVADLGLERQAIDGLITQTTQDGSGQMEVARFGQMIGLNPSTSGSLAYGTAGFSISFAAALIAHGQASCVACVYATNQKTQGYRFRKPLRPEWGVFGAYNPATMAALGFNRYIWEYDQDPDKLAAVAVTLRNNAAQNPIAYRRTPITKEDYLTSRYITWPLRIFDIASISDGAACIILGNEEIAEKSAHRPVNIKAIARRDQLRMLQNPNHLLLPHLKDLAANLYDRAEQGPEDVDVLYVQDPHSPMIIWALESFGFCPPGMGLDFVQGENIGLQGSIPVNPNGGQLSEGYMVGWLHHVDAVRQIRGECGPRQIPDCQSVAFCTSGGFREYSIGIMLNGS